MIEFRELAVGDLFTKPDASDIIWQKLAPAMSGCCGRKQKVNVLRITGKKKKAFVSDFTKVNKVKESEDV